MVVGSGRSKRTGTLSLAIFLYLSGNRKCTTLDHAWNSNHFECVACQIMCVMASWSWPRGVNFPPCFLGCLHHFFHMCPPSNRPNPSVGLSKTPACKTVGTQPTPYHAAPYLQIIPHAYSKNTLESPCRLNSLPWQIPWPVELFGRRQAAHQSYPPRSTLHCLLTLEILKVVVYIWSKMNWRILWQCRRNARDNLLNIL